MEEGKSRGPDVRVPPPLLYALPLAMGFVVQRFVPINIVSGDGPAKIIDLAGAAEIFIGVLLAAWAVLTFRRLRTPVIPIRPARTLSIEGPYTMTRNPMYLSFALVYLGVTFVTNAFWPLLFLPEALVFTYLFAIRREERYLAREFGDAYTEYCARVRRWI
jgi:protein-S-isoprenylcysteine O-methyltransferase Ste14